MKRNPRPRKYASDSERQAAFRARNVMVEFRAENKTADTLNKIADEIDVSRSDLVLSMVKFALTNHDWARFGLTHKTIPLYKGNPMATKKPSPAQLAARQKFADMVRARAAAAKGKKMPRKTAIKKNPMNYSQIDMLKTAYSGIQGIDPASAEYKRLIALLNSLDQKTLKDLADAKIKFVSSLARNRVKRQTNPIIQYIVYSELSPQKYKQMLVTENKQRAIQTADINQMENYHSVVEDQVGHLIYDAATRKKYMTNPRKKTVSQKISQLEHEGYPHKQSIAIALSEQRRGKVKRNPSGEIGAYEITRNFKVLGIFKTKADAIKAAQGISDATGKTIAVKPVQVLAGHFDR